MEIAVVSPKSIKIKTKQSLLFAGEQLESKVKNPADATLLLGDTTSPHFFSEENGVVFQGAGEYEVKAVKITGSRIEKQVMYTISADGLSVFVGKVSTATLAKDKVHEHDVAVLEADEVVAQSVIGLLNASAIVLYGEKAQESAKAIGKEAATASKYAVTKDKLPSETEVTILA